MRSIAIAALVVAVAAFVGLWSRRSPRPTPRAARPDHGVAARGPSGDAGGRRILWKGPGAVARGLISSADERYLAGVLCNSQPHSPEDRLWRRVVVVDSERGMLVFDVRVLEPLAIGFVGGSRSIAVLSNDIIGGRTTIQVYGVETKMLQVEINCDSGRNTDRSLGISGDGRRLALRSCDRSGNESFRAWDAATGEPVPFATESYSWSGTRISPNGELLAHGGYPGPGIRISSARIGEDGFRSSVSFCLRQDGEYSFRHDWPMATTWSPDSGRFLIVYLDGTLIDWRIAPGADARPVQIGDQGEFETCTSVALSQSADQLFYSLEDGTIRAFRVNREWSLTTSTDHF